MLLVITRYTMINSFWSPGYRISCSSEIGKYMSIRDASKSVYNFGLPKLCESERNCMLRYHTRAQSNIFLATMLIEGLTAWGLAYWWSNTVCQPEVEQPLCRRSFVSTLAYVWYQRDLPHRIWHHDHPGAPGLPGENHGGFSSPVGCSRDRRFLKNTAHGSQVPHRSSPVSAPDIQSLKEC